MPLADTPLILMSFSPFSRRPPCRRAAVFFAHASAFDYCHAATPPDTPLPATPPCYADAISAVSPFSPAPPPADYFSASITPMPRHCHYFRCRQRAIIGRFARFRHAIIRCR
jgi:hypothetical protein